MKTKLITLLVLVIFVNTYAQFGPQQIITTNLSFGSSVYATDIDGDGDMDVLSASEGGFGINVQLAWYENDGEGNFGPQQIILENTIDDTVSVYATDIDGDGDMDVLSASIGKIAWHENIDGLGDFGPQQIITTNVEYASSVYATDIDGDGDMDVLSASQIDNKIAWYENVNGDGTVWTEHIITSNALGAWSVYATDIDGDGDIDVLSASELDNEIAWYENVNGLGTVWTEHIISPDAGMARSVYSTDIDGDGDMDVLSASGDNKIAWYENDGNGDFGPQQIITTNALGTWSVYFTDIDGDGDMDVISGEIAWYENLDGLGDFGPKQIFDIFNAWSVYAEDLDGDGDMDVLAIDSQPGEGELVWYENLTPLGVNENALLDISVFPSPTTGFLYIQSTIPITQIDVYNQLGQLVVSNNNKNTIDISSVSQGIYFIKVKDENGNIGSQKVLKK